MVGTPAFASPEQLAGRHDLLGEVTDVYGLGATLYALLTGRPPVESQQIEEILRRVQQGDIPPPRSIDPAIPKPLEAICRKAMALKPEHRYPSVRALAVDVTRWLDDLPVIAWPEPLWTRVSRWGRRHQVAVSVVAACSIMALLFLWVAAVRAERQTRLVASYEVAAERQAQILANYEITGEALVDLIEMVTDQERPVVNTTAQSSAAIVSPAPPSTSRKPQAAPSTPMQTYQALEALRHRFQDVRSRLETGGQGQLATKVDAIIKQYDSKIRQLGSTAEPGFGGGLDAASRAFPMMGD
jgi:hypothetical protein